MSRLAFVGALFYTAAAEVSAFETVALLQSMPIPSEDAVSLDLANRTVEQSISEIFAFPKGMKAAVERARSNSTRKKEVTWPQQLDELMDNSKSPELAQMVLDIAHDFNHFYKRSMEITQKILNKFKLGILNLAQVKDWMKLQFVDMTKFAYASHEHIMKVVEDFVAAKKAEDAETEDNDDLWDWGDDKDTAADLAASLKDMVEHVEKPLQKVLLVWGTMQAKLFDITRVQFCQQCVTALQTLIDLKEVTAVEYEPMAQFMNTMVHKYHDAKLGLNHWFHAVHDKLGTECVIAAEMFFESVKSWVTYVNASIGGIIAHSMNCPVTVAPELTPVPGVKSTKHSELAKP